MSRGNKGFIRTWGGRLWALVDGTRRAVFNLLWLALLIGVPVALFLGRADKLQDKTVLVLDLAGPLVEQGAGGTRDTLLRQVQGQDQGQVRLRDVIVVLDAAARDPKIERVLLLPEDLAGGGLSAQREVAAALERFKASGKQVVAWSTRLDQRQYYLAAHASEVYLHPMGAVFLQGYGSLRNYYRQALDRVGVSANVVRVGRYKNAAEPFFASAPSRRRWKPRLTSTTHCGTCTRAGWRRHASCRKGPSHRALPRCRAACRRCRATPRGWHWKSGSWTASRPATSCARC